MFPLLKRSSSSAFKLWKMWWRPAALRVVAWRHETLSPIWLWFSSTLDSDQICTTPSRHTVMNLRSIVAAWPRISHLFFKPKMKETPETGMAFQLGIVARWKKCWISFFSFVRRLWNSGLRFFNEFSNVPQLQEQRSLCDFAVCFSLSFQTIALNSKWSALHAVEETVWQTVCSCFWLWARLQLAWFLQCIQYSYGDSYYVIVLVY